MKCPECSRELKEVKVAVEGTENRVISYQCPKCNYFEFDKKSGEEIISEIQSHSQSLLTIKQRIINISHDRLGTYFNENIVRSLNLRAGEEILVSTPDPKHIIIQLDAKRYMKN